MCSSVFIGIWKWFSGNIVTLSFFYQVSSDLFHVLVKKVYFAFVSVVRLTYIYVSVSVQLYRVAIVDENYPIF